MTHAPVVAGVLFACAAVSAVEQEYDFRKDMEIVHRTDWRNPAAAKAAEGEFEFTDGVALVLPKEADDFVLRVVRDFEDYLSVSMNVMASVRRCGRCPVGAAVVAAIDPSLRDRQYRIVVDDHGVRLSGKDSRALAQAFYRLENRMNMRGAPILACGEELRRPRLDVRMAHSGYGMIDFPEPHLARMAHQGVNAITFVVEDIDVVDYGRRADVRAIIRRAAKYGIDTYLYCGVNAFVHPRDPGGMEEIDNVYGRVVGHYPEAKGVVFVGESCQFPSKDPRVQPRKWGTGDKNDRRPLAGWFPCSDYPEWLEAVKACIHKRAPKMEMVFWTYNWGWAPYEDRMKLIDVLPKDVTLEATFEMFERKTYPNGIDSPTADYTLSVAGPGKYFASEAERAKRNGLRLFSQANCGGRTWDFGTVPFEPCPQQWNRRWQALNEASEKWGLAGVMESHHYGWSENFISELENEALTEGGVPFDEHLRQIAARDFGAANAETAIAVWRQWSDDIVNYVPTDLNQYGTFRIGPAYPFTFGHGIATPEEFPALHPFRFVRTEYLKHGFVPELTKERSDDAFLEKEIELFIPIAAHYDEGAAAFEKMADGLAGRQRREALRMANLARYFAADFRTAINVKRGAMAERRCDAAGILAAAKAEYANATAALRFVEEDSRLGWEPCMDYCGGLRQIRWKLARMEKDFGKENLK